MYDVLIVDDERYIREGLREFIDWRAEGFSIHAEADDGEAALQLIRRQPPDVVLCDIRMPHVDGLSLVDAVRKELDRAPIFIMLSGYDDFAYAQRALRLGVSNYLLKPVQREELLEELRRIRARLDEDDRAAPAVSSGLDFLLRSPGTEALAEALGVSPATAQGAETCVYRFVVTHFTSMSDVGALFDDVERWFVCNDRPLTRRTEATVLDCVHVRGHSLRRRTLREFEEHVASRCESLRLSLRVFRSRVVAGLVQVSDAFETIGEAVESAFYSDEVFTYRAQNPMGYGYDPLPAARIRALSRSIVSLSQESLTGELEEIERALRERPIYPESVLGAASALFVDIWELVAEKEGSIEELESFSGGAPQPDVDRGLRNVLADVRAYCSTVIGYLKSIHSDTDNQIVRDIELYIGRHVTESLRVKDIAEHLGLHPYYVGRLFKEQRGMSIIDYVHEKRIENAKKMLITRQAPLSDIAAWVGYSDAEYFSRKFKEIVGVSPRAFRERFL